MNFKYYVPATLSQNSVIKIGKKNIFSQYGKAHGKVVLGRSGNFLFFQVMELIIILSQRMVSLIDCNESSRAGSARNK